MRILRKKKKPVAHDMQRRHGAVAKNENQPLPGAFVVSSLLSLESRMMFDGAAVATAGAVTSEQVAQDQAKPAVSVDDVVKDDAPPSAPTGEPQFTTDEQALFDALEAYDASAARQEIVFVSSSVREYQKLVDGISPNVEVHILDSSRDGVQQMSEVLAGRTGIDAIHLIGNGTEGEMELGASLLTQTSISTQYAEQFEQISRTLSAGADILLYGSSFGHGDAGQAAIQSLAALTGADVAASTDRTGSAVEHGNWKLETSTGSIETAVVIGASTQTTWEHELTTANNSNDNGTATAPAAESTDKSVLEQTQELAGAADTTASAVVRQEVVFIDPTVRDFQTLLNGIDNPNARIVILDPNKDGLQQVSQVLQQMGEVDAVHIISHGSEGQLDLGSTALNAITMSEYADQMAQIKAHLTDDADILIYGCNFGKGADGLEATNMLAQMTGADIAASTDDTGDAALGGNWSLELQTGAIESHVIVSQAAQEAYHDLLALHLLDFDTTAAWTPTDVTNQFKVYTVDGSNLTISYTPAVFGTPTLSSSYSGGVIPAQNALQFTVGATGSNTITIDFSAQPGGGVSNVGFALYDVDNAESAVFSALKTDGTTIIAPTQVATSAFNTISAGTPGSGTSVTVSGTGSDSTATTPQGNTYVYFNTSGIKSVSFTYSGTANTTLVVLNDITFMGGSTNPPLIDLDASSIATQTAGDNFATQAYTGSTGTIPWSGPWVETDATAGGSPTAGQVQVVDTPTAGTDYGLRLNNSGTASQFTGASRTIDLSGYNTPTLNFDYITSTGLSAADSVVLEVSSNGGANWTLLKTFTGSSPSSTNYTAQSVSLSGYESANTMIRFRISGTAAYTGANEYFYVDNVQISGQPTSSANTYTEGGPSVLIAATANASVVDSDSANMSQARVEVRSLVAGDTLTWSTTGTGITGSYDSVTGILSLTGLDSKANYQSVIDSIRFSNTGDDPTLSGTRTTRDVAITVRDDNGNESNTAISRITITAVNDAPVNTVPGAQGTFINTALVFSNANGNLVSVADLDATNVQVTLTSTNGTMTLSGIVGLAFSSGDGTADATMTFSGTKAAVNTALAGMSFNPTAAFTGAAMLTVTTSDLGSTGTGGTLTDTDVVNITVVPAGGVFTSSDSVTTNENNSVTVTASGVLTNDLNQTGTLTAVGAGLQYVTSADGTANATWEDQAATAPNIDLALAGTVTRNNTPSTNYPGITQSYVFSPTAITGATAASFTEAQTEASASFEFLLKVDASIGASGNYLIYEAGSSGQGFSVLYNAAANQIELRYNDQDNAQTTTRTVALGANNPRNEFIQVVAVFDDNAANTVNVGLYVNGVTNGTAFSLSSTADLATELDWANQPGAASSGLGTVSGTAELQGADAAPVTVSAFQGEIAIMRMYNGTVLSPAQITGNFGSVSDHTWVSGAQGNAALQTMTEPVPGAAPSSVNITTAKGALVTVNSDGSYTYNPNGQFESLAAGQTDTDTFNYRLSDVFGNTATGTVTVTITGVNDAPVVDLNAGGAGQDVTTAFTEQTPVLIAPVGTLSDVDSANLTSLTVTLTARPDGNGVEALSLNAAATTAATGAGLTVSYTPATGVLSITGSATTAVYQTILQGIQYNNTSDTPTTSNRAITVVANDGAVNSATQTVTLTVTSVNDAPVNTVPGAQTVAEDTALAIAGVSVTDVDGNLATTQLAVGNGTVTVSLAGGATISAGANGTGTLTLSGTQAQINAALATISYQGNLNFNGADLLTVTSTDSNAVVDTDTVAITVTSVNDAPVMGAATTVSVAENTKGVGTFAATDPDLGDTRIYSLSGPDAGLFTINATTGAVSFIVAPDFESGAGPYSITVTATDAGGLSATQNVTVNVTNVNEVPSPPVLTVPPSLLPIPNSGPPSVSPVVGPMPGGPPIVFPTGNGSAPVLPPPVALWAPGKCDSGGDPEINPAAIMAQMWMPGSCENDGTATIEAGVPDDSDRRAGVTGRTVSMAENPPDVVLDNRIAQLVEPLSLPVKKMLESGRKMAVNLDRLADDLTRSMEERERQAQLMGRVASFSGMALTAGFSVWILRGGSLLMSFLVSMPVWRHFDPVPVLGISRRDRKKIDQQARTAQQQENDRFRGLERVVRSELNPMKKREQKTGLKKGKKA